MTNKHFRIVGDEAPTVTPPSNEELSLISEYLGDPDTTEWFRELLAKQIAIVANDKMAARGSSKKLFDAINDGIEGFIAPILEGFIPWNLLQDQPCIAARAIKAGGHISYFLKEQFCSDIEYMAVVERNVDKNEISIYDYFLASFLVNADAVIESQRCLSIIDLYEFRKEEDVRSGGVFSFLGGYRPYTHAFVCRSKAKTGDCSLADGVNQHVALIEGGEYEWFNKFCDEIASGEAAPDAYGWQKYNIRGNNRSNIVNFIYKRRHDYYNEFISALSKKWDRKDFLTRIRFDHTNYSNLDELEGCISNDLRNGGESEAVGEDVQRKEISSASAVAERLAELDRYVVSFPRQPVSGLVLELFPEIQAETERPVALPTMAPETWPEDRRELEGKLETPPAFIKRVYGEWEGRGLSKKLIRGLDPALYRALYNWLQRGNALPDDLDLPTNSEQIDRDLESGGQSYSAREAIREAARVQSNLRRRMGREGQ